MARIASGVTGASPIFNKLMTAILKGTASNAWDIPQGLDKVTVCLSAGTLPCQGCPGRAEWFLTGTAPKKACIAEEMAKSKEEKPNGTILEPAASTGN
jgi:membrane carboxypeptidase/penicillin-binding protein